MAAVNVISILKAKGLRLTGGRKEILGVLLNESVALSHVEIKEKLKIHLDRITSYRTLLSFKKKGLVHVVLDPKSGVPKYCLNKPGLPHFHAHFKCRNCNALTCIDLDAEKVASLSIPPGYVVQTYSFVVEGKCNRCKKVKTKYTDYN